MTPNTMATLALAVVCAIGCAKKPDENRINSEIISYWKPCTFVKPTPIKITAVNKSSVRFTYNVVILKNGSDVKPNECPAANSSMLEALAMEDIAKLKMNAEVDVTMEQGF